MTPGESRAIGIVPTERYSVIHRYGHNDVDVGCMSDTFDAIKGRWPLAPAEVQRKWVDPWWDGEEDHDLHWNSIREVAPDVYAGWWDDVPPCCLDAHWADDTDTDYGNCVFVWRKGKPMEGIAIHRHRGLAIRINKAIKRVA